MHTITLEQQLKIIILAQKPTEEIKRKAKHTWLIQKKASNEGEKGKENRTSENK